MLVQVVWERGCWWDRQARFLEEGRGTHQCWEWVRFRISNQVTSCGLTYMYRPQRRVQEAGFSRVGHNFMVRAPPVGVDEWPQLQDTLVTSGRAEERLRAPGRTGPGLTY